MGAAVGKRGEVSYLEMFLGACANGSAGVVDLDYILSLDYPLR